MLCEIYDPVTNNYTNKILDVLIYVKRFALMGVWLTAKETVVCRLRSMLNKILNKNRAYKFLSYIQMQISSLHAFYHVWEFSRSPHFATVSPKILFHERAILLQRNFSYGTTYKRPITISNKQSSKLIGFSPTPLNSVQTTQTQRASERRTIRGRKFISKAVKPSLRGTNKSSSLRETV